METGGVAAGTVFAAAGWGLCLGSATAVLGFVSTLIGLILIIINGIVIPMIKWAKKAKADGKITADELIEGAEILSDGLEKAKDEIDSSKH